MQATELELKFEQFDVPFWERFGVPCWVKLEQVFILEIMKNFQNLGVMREHTDFLKL